MIFIRSSKEFGELLIEDTFLFFDGPRLFTAVNPVGQRYIVNCLDATDTEDFWLLTPVSERRLSSLKDGDLQLRDAFEFPELKMVYKVSTSHSGDLISQAELSSSGLSDDVLPLAGVYLPTREQATPLVSAPFLARTLNANIVLLRLFPQTTRHEAPADSVGEILSAFSDFLKEKLQSAYRRAGSAVSEVVAASIPEVNVVGAFASSLGVEFAVRGDEATVMDALRGAVQDLASVADLEELYGRMSEVEAVEASSMKRFLYRLASVKSDLSVETASVSDEVSLVAELPLKTVRRGVRHLRTPRTDEAATFETYEVELIGLNLRTRRFEVRTISDGQPMSGTLNAEVFSEVSKAELPSRYRTVIEIGPPLMGKRGRLKMVSATKL